MTNNNSPKKPESENHIETLETRPKPSPNEIRLNELWHLAVGEREDIFTSIEKKSEIPYYFKLVGYIAEPMKKKSYITVRPSSHWEIWRDSNKCILIFKVVDDDYELLAYRDLGLTHILSEEVSTEILKAIMKLFRMFD